MTSYPELRGKAALVTGGNRGIGRAIALGLAGEGVDVAVVGRGHAEDAASTAKQIAELGVRGHYSLGDVSSADDVTRFIGEAVDAIGTIDILVNCAGGFLTRQTLLETSEDDWDRLLAVNLKSAYLCCRAVLPAMIERGWGRIVNVSSGTGRMPNHLTSTAYAASKAGMLGLTRQLAWEVAKDGVTVNAIAPGTTPTDRAKGLSTPERRAAAAAATAMGRVGAPEDQAGAVVFLASDAASYITGATIDINGGKLML
ncbi:SDR family NAD(P)-dependent oxidoreductase [Jiangella ureilytica]|uniref:SDR family NAD(P)-dependent oxidoreductase n=1 Tax=Jiangella ureilytica TaxID=2530374 RepID=UPI0013A5DF94|nr:3-oxoacyl-ACP reductase family protein [Jiangella ureilytica]